MTNPIYRRRQRDQRRIIEDGSFYKGMYYTNNLVDSATSRLLLNYTLRDNGNYISPRLGISMERNQEIKQYNRPHTQDSVIPGPHVKYYGVYRDSDGLDKFGTIILSFGVPSDPEFKYYFTKENPHPSYYDQAYINNGTAFGFIEDFDGEFHQIDASALGETRLRFYENTPKPLYTVFNNKLYIIDGSSNGTNEYQDYNASGSFSRYTEFPYDGTFNSLIVKPTTYDLPEVKMETFDKSGNMNGIVHIPVPLRFLKSNGVTDSFDFKKGSVIQRVNEMGVDEYSVDAVLEEGNFVNFLKFKKPDDSIFKGIIIEDVYRTSNFGNLEELKISDKVVLDSTSYLDKYSVLADAEYICIVVPKEFNIGDAIGRYSDLLLRYEYKVPKEFLVDMSNTLKITTRGYLLFNDVTNLFPISAIYDITYKQPIVTYAGGLLEVQVAKSADKFSLRVVPIEAKLPSISEATSVGFNMLAPNPYAFQNKEGQLLRPLGIMPYVPNSSQQISMSANVGEDIEFEVIYEYVKNAKYFVKWEYLGVGVGETNLEPIVLQDYGTTTIAAGTRVKRIIRANDVRFSLRVTMAPPNKEGKPDETLAKVVSYPIYQAGNTYLKDISSYKYDLHNARGLGSYKTMLCLWGVPGADTTIFFSDIDDVSYFPFANNIIAFDYKILGIQNYQGGLLIFTTHSIYLLTGNISKDFEVIELYQNLTFTQEDMESLIVIKNTIFIRSGSSYYTLVPNTYTGEVSDIKLTNISAPIKELVDDWEGFLEFLGENVFDWDISFSNRTEIVQYDFVNYIDDNKIKNVYRFGIFETKNDRLYRYQIDIVLVFNSNRGTWTVETMNLPFNDFLADSKGLYSSYARAFGPNTKYFYQELDYKNWSRKDIYNMAVYGSAFNDTITSPREVELQELPSTMEDKVVRVIDGDTVVLEKLGNFRLLYVNTPEHTTIHEDYGAEASAYARELLPIGSTVRVEFEGDRSDKYDRSMGWLFNEQGLLVQLKLAEKGMVKSVYSFGVNRYTDILDAAIEQAYEDKVGLWAFSKSKPQYVYASATLNLAPNYQVLDTGNKNHDPYLQKRFREFQFQIINRSEDNLAFFNRFYLESVPQQDYRDYEIVHDADRLSPNYGTIEVVPVDTSNLEVSAATFLNTWQLGVNQFPELDIMKVRFRISGKARYGRMLMISKNEANYDLLSYAWVIRAMNFR